MTDRRMELLAPAGDFDALRAAVQNGADAVYLGAGSFNARRNAANFEGKALDEAVAYCHARGVKVHVTLNTLVREDELDALEREIRAVNGSGADAVIVSDLGVAAALRRMAPDIELHASTQLAIHNAQGVAFARDHGYHRAVLAREMPFDEIARCAGQGIEIEAFVHGALCVACSGQCLMSSFIGGRSGNRGLCAQPCRLPWRLDGREGYLLSTRDLCGLDLLARYRDAGVDSLKIEGRLKRAEYVAVTVAAYRRALDALYGGATVDPEAERRALAQMFNRGGFTHGYGPGMAERELMFPDRPNHIGAEVGACRRDGEVLLAEAVLPADALVLRRAGREDAPVKLSGGAGEKVRCPQARRGDRLFRLVSDAQMKAARESFRGEHRQATVDLAATLKVGRPARLSASDGFRRVEVAGEIVQQATGRPFDPDRAEAQLRRTGGTAWAVGSVTIDADPDAFCPASLLNGLRRDALAALEQARVAISRTTNPLARPEGVFPGSMEPSPRLIAQSADPDVLARAIDSGADAAVLAPRDVRPEALEAIDLPGLIAGLNGRPLGLALPAVLSTEALAGLNGWALRNRNCFDTTYLSNIGQLGLEWPGRRVGDYMLNAANRLTLERLAAWGLDGFTPSVELNAGQISELGGYEDLILWGRIPLMHLRHCPLRAAEGMKGRHADCRHCDACVPDARLDGREMTDRRGAAFPLRRLAQPGGCVVQVLNSAALMPLRRLDRLPKARRWRLLLGEGEPAEAIVKVYRAAMDGGDFRRLPEWQTIDQMDTTTGHYFRGVE